MNKLIAVLATLVGATSLNAQELSMSANFGYETDYYFRGVQLADGIYTGGVDLSYGDFYAGLWTANPNDNAYSNELDLYAGYGMSISDTISADFGFCYYTYPDLDDDIFDNDVNTLEFYAGLAFDIPASPSIYVYYDKDLEAWTAEGSIGYSAPLSEKTSLDFALSAGGVDTDGGADYFYGQLSVDYIYNLTDSSAFSIGGRFTMATEDYAKYGDDDSDFWGGASFTCGF
jgi:uncharacterized protein (TIGR02001 family)